METPSATAEIFDHTDQPPANVLLGDKSEEIVYTIAGDRKLTSDGFAWVMDRKDAERWQKQHGAYLRFLEEHMSPSNFAEYLVLKAIERGEIAL